MTLLPPSTLTLDHLLAAPDSVLTSAGQPRFGRYVGQTGSVDWSGLAMPYARSRLWRHFHHKRWQYIALSCNELFCGIAIVDVGWTNTAFAYAFDRRQRKEVGGFSQNGLPGLTARVAHCVNGASFFRFPGKRIDYQPAGEGREARLQVRCGAFEIDAKIDDSAMLPLLAVGPIEGGSVHMTQKSSGMPLKGRVKAGGAQYVLDGGVASFDYSNGLLARETRWRWASAYDLKLGFNLQSGYFGTQENALWLDGEWIALGQAHFDYNSADPMAPWHIYTDDDLLDLHFQPEGARHENKNLFIAASRYVQPIGTFSGWVRPADNAPVRIVKQLAGVTEDHYSRW